MNLRLVSIELDCRSGNVDYKFNEHISALYGNIGVGKTSLLNLISFCLGNDLIHTLAIDDEVRRCKLSVLYNDFPVTFTRQLSENRIRIKGNGHERQVKARDASGDISDFFYKEEGIEQLFWLPKKNAPNQKKVRVSFANYYWFSYLNQDEIDSSLFYLKDSQNYYKQIASKSVLFGCLGGDGRVELDLQDQLKNISAALEKTKQRITYGKEILSSSSIFSVNITSEILKKKQDIQTMKQQVDDAHAQGSIIYEREDMEKLLKLQHTIGLYEAEVKYLSILGRVKSLIESETVARQAVESELVTIEKEKTQLLNQSFVVSENIELFKKLFIDTLKRVKFPGMEEGDTIRLSPTDFFPILYTFSGKKKADYYTLSSGGKKTIYKICFAIAIHRLIASRHLKTLIPRVLMLDTPMKNISEREDVELYNALFKLLHDLFSAGGELESTQLIIVDKELHPYFANKDITQYHLTSEKPLIPFYRP